MKTPMLDLVAKAQGKDRSSAMAPNEYGRYRYNRRLKTLHELSVISGIAESTLHSRFQRGTYGSVEEVVDTPSKPRKRNI